VLLDANLLLYAVDTDAPEHAPAAEWLTRVLRGDRRVGLPWSTIGAFLRISTHPRIYDRPLSSDEATRFVSEWLDAEPTWIPPTTRATFAQYAALTAEVAVTGNLVPDALLAALALEHGLTVLSADTDFARFPGVRAENPLR
jgi:toxin-antitoxin system PIN domain toxin